MNVRFRKRDDKVIDYEEVKMLALDLGMVDETDVIFFLSFIQNRVTVCVMKFR